MWSTSSGVKNSSSPTLGSQSGRRGDTRSVEASLSGCSGEKVVAAAVDTGFPVRSTAAEGFLGEGRTGVTGSCFAGDLGINQANQSAYPFHGFRVGLPKPPFLAGAGAVFWSGSYYHSTVNILFLRDPKIS